MTSNYFTGINCAVLSSPTHLNPSKNNVPPNANGQDGEAQIIFYSKPERYVSSPSNRQDLIILYYTYP